MTDINSAAVENILSRRSIRKYDPRKEIPDSVRSILLECACAAPSAHNYKPWHFIIVEGRERLNAIADVHPYGKMLSTATLAVVVCGTTEGGADYSFWEHDCSAAMQNILLAANACGLGSVWLGVRHGVRGLEEQLKQMFGVPANTAILGVAAVGYPLAERDPHKGVDAHAVHINKW